ncbi:DNA ligase [Luteimonas terricola]|uniref:ATP-dependent DNA ligase n=1 Tax=Luteimonas terricola TaxID=645597 RepID=A0ABQ2EB99_9GAMM|nr:DNA ligase [Luteimonas terricola]GGK04805.1 ATP-dependent DNA ligase [Luteimonas terricola]
MTALALALTAALAAAPAAADDPGRGQGLMLATMAQDGHDPGTAHPVTEYWASEKLDGVRGRWDGRRLWTRGGYPVDAPPWFTAGWPAVAMDGELWLGRGRFEEASSLVRNPPAGDAAWRDMRFIVFDLPDHGGPFEERVHAMRALADGSIPGLRPVAQSRVAGRAQLQRRLQAVLDAGGEGLMLHHRDARYLPGRSDGLLKLKPHDDAEARVVAHLPGNGKYAGLVGSLLVERDDGARFRLGSGLGDADRVAPPALGSLVTYRYNGLTVNGLPRFPRYLRLREPPKSLPAGP